MPRDSVISQDLWGTFEKTLYVWLWSATRRWSGRPVPVVFVQYRIIIQNLEFFSSICLLIITSVYYIPDEMKNVFGQCFRTLYKILGTSLQILGTMTSLETLVLSNNNLKELPAHIGWYAACTHCRNIA